MSTLMTIVVSDEPTFDRAKVKTNKITKVSIFPRR